MRIPSRKAGGVAKWKSGRHHEAIGSATHRVNWRTLMNWKGVMPAITTSFNEDLHVDHGNVRKHCVWLLDNGCAGIVALGSLGEGATLLFDEKLEILRTCVSAVEGRGECRMRRSHGVAAVCLSGQLAGDESARRHCV